MNVSIIVPAYQSERFIARAIRSALDQDYPRHLYEIIVVNDGSTDHTADILENFKEDVRIITHDRNKGLAAARNTGIRKAHGRYVLNLDSDDYLDSNMLRVGCLFLDLNPEIDAVSLDYILVDDQERHLTRESAAKEPIACGIFFRMEQLVEIGLYDEDFLVREEEDLRYRFQRQYRIHHVPLPLYRYRQHDRNITGNTQLMQKYQEVLKNKHSELL